MHPILEVKSISKSFGDLVANSEISFAVSKGEVLAILGENGAGKTTLMNILFGHYMPDKGSINFKNNRLKFGNTGNSISLGIGMVHQHFTLADNLTVLENIIIGHKSLFSVSLSKKRSLDKLNSLINRFNLPINPNAMVSDLSVSEKQRLEILKTLYKDCELLILDEPTAALTPQETDALYKTINNMVKQGLSVILISHKLNEVLSVSDRIIVLRNGKMVGEQKTKKADYKSIASLIVGKEIIYPEKTKSIPKDQVLSVKNIFYQTEIDLDVKIKNLNLELYGGEIIGIAGVAGNGQQNFAKLLSGHAKPSSGKLYIGNKEIIKFNPQSFMELGVAYIPEDRNKDGLVGDMSIWENAIMTETSNSEIVTNFGFIKTKISKEKSSNICRLNDVRYQSINQPTRLLSGGNVQKLLIGKWLNRKPKVIIACQPTRGLDEGAIAAVHEMILSARDDGNGIIIIGEDLDELISLSDKICVMYNGKLSNPLISASIDKLKIGMMMSGESFIND
jgi:simple sugar transport system ATP-binding protein